MYRVCRGYGVTLQAVSNTASAGARDAKRAGTSPKTSLGYQHGVLAVTVVLRQIGGNCKFCVFMEGELRIQSGSHGVSGP